MDQGSVGAAGMLEVLDEGRVRVVDEGGQSDRGTGTERDDAALQAGRARPMHWVSGTVAEAGGTGAAERQGCNSLVFAIEATDGAWHGVLKGALPTGPRGEYYDAVMQKQQQDWLLPAILGDRRGARGEDGTTMPGHPNVLSVLHSFMGSSQLLVPWLGWIDT